MITISTDRRGLAWGTALASKSSVQHVAILWPPFANIRREWWRNTERNIYDSVISQWTLIPARKSHDYN